MRKIIFFIILLSLISLVSSLPSDTEVEKIYGIQKDDILNTSHRAVEIILLKDGIFYQENYTLLFPDNGGGYLLFILPEDVGRSEVKNIDLYDIKSNKRFQEYDNITDIDNCSNLFMEREINNTLTILSCPDVKNREVEISMTATLRSQSAPEQCTTIDYFLNFPEIYVGVIDSFTENFKLDFSLTADNSIVVDQIPNTGCRNVGMDEHPLENGVSCSGKPNVTGTSLFLENISIFGRDKNKLGEQASGRESIREWIGWILATLFGFSTFYLAWNKHIRDKPLIEIRKYLYKAESMPADYDEPSYEIRTLIVDIKNSGKRDAHLKEVSPYYVQVGKTPYIPRMRGFGERTIGAGDRERVHLFFEFPPDVIEEIERQSTNEIVVEFDFVHKKIRKLFVIRNTI